MNLGRRAFSFSGLMFSCACTALQSSEPTISTTPKVRDEFLSAETADLAKSLEALIPELLEEFPTPGAAVAVIREGQVIFAKGFGYSDLSIKSPILEDTLFNVGSISKPMTAWGVMRLVEDGKLDLNRPIQAYVSRWKLPPSSFDHDAVTANRILSHTAGLSLGGWPGWGPQEKLPSLEQALSGATNGRGDLRVTREPGKLWAYSGGGYMLLELAVEELTRMPFSEFMKTEVLAPLGLSSSTFDPDPPTELLQRRSKCYDWRLNETPCERFTGISAAGLQMTLSDLSKFTIAAIEHGQGSPERRILKPETFHRMTTLSPPAQDWGLGYMIRKAHKQEFVGHTGLNMGWCAAHWFVPESRSGLVVLTNGDNGQYVQAAVTCRWLHSVVGDELTWACVDAPRKHLYRVEALIEHAVENKTINRDDGGRLLGRVRGMILSIEEKRFAETIKEIANFEVEVKGIGELYKAIQSSLDRSRTWLERHQP